MTKRALGSMSAEKKSESGENVGCRLKNLVLSEAFRRSTSPKHGLVFNGLLTVEVSRS